MWAKKPQLPCDFVHDSTRVKCFANFSIHMIFCAASANPLTCGAPAAVESGAAAMHVQRLVYSESFGSFCLPFSSKFLFNALWSIKINFHVVVCRLPSYDRSYLQFSSVLIKFIRLSSLNGSFRKLRWLYLKWCLFILEIGSCFVHKFMITFNSNKWDPLSWKLRLIVAFDITPKSHTETLTHISYHVSLAQIL